VIPACALVARESVEGLVWAQSEQTRTAEDYRAPS
jgi:hypothetical protein